MERGEGERQGQRREDDEKGVNKKEETYTLASEYANRNTCSKLLYYSEYHVSVCNDGCNCKSVS